MRRTYDIDGRLIKTYLERNFPKLSGLLERWNGEKHPDKIDRYELHDSFNLCFSLVGTETKVVMCQENNSLNKITFGVYVRGIKYGEKELILDSGVFESLTFKDAVTLNSYCMQLRVIKLNKKYVLEVSKGGFEITDAADINRMFGKSKGIARA